MRNSNRLMVGAVVTALLVVGPQSVSTSVDAAAKKFSSCSLLLKQYRNGVAATKKARGKTKALVSAAVYRVNKKLDIDGDGIACDAGDLKSESGSASAAAKKFTPRTYEGSGDKTITLSLPAGFVAAAIVEFDGEEGVTLTTLDADENTIDFPIMSFGPYSGTVLLSRGADPDEPVNVAAIEIVGQGNWKVKVVSAATLPVFKGEADGDSDVVYRYTGGDIDLDVAHDGEESFAITLYDKAGVLSEITVDEYGEFNDIYQMSASAYISIRATAAWSIAEA